MEPNGECEEVKKDHCRPSESESRHNFNQSQAKGTFDKLQFHANIKWNREECRSQPLELDEDSSSLVRA